MKILKPILLIGIALAALVLVAELIVRFAFPVPMEPAGSMSLSNEIPGLKKNVSFRFDGDYLRKMNWSKKRSSSNPRVLCVGGNGTTAMLQNAEDTWWGNLGTQLSKDLGKPVEIGSIGILPRGQILPALVMSEKLLERYDVDLIICSLGFGDALGFPGDYKYDPGKLEKIRGQEPSGFKYQLAKASHLLRIVRNKRRARSQEQRAKAISQPNFYRDYLVAMNQLVSQRPVADRLIRTGDDPLKEYLEGIDGFVALAKKKGAALLVVGEPTIYKSTLGAKEAARVTVLWNPVTPKSEEVVGVRLAPLAVESELQRFYAAAAEKCEAAGVPFVNLQGDVPRYVDNFVTETYLTDLGAKTVAEKLGTAASSALAGR